MGKHVLASPHWNFPHTQYGNAAKAQWVQVGQVQLLQAGVQQAEASTGGAVKLKQRRMFC